MTKQLSAGQAATFAGVSKSTVCRAVEDGRLHANRTRDGWYSIDEKDLMRVFGDRPRFSPGDLREQLREAREQRDAWQKQAENLYCLLAEISQRRASR